VRSRREREKGGVYRETEREIWRETERREERERV
jgi:hypothetical protein